MGTTRFDNLTRSVSLSGSRRGVLGGIAAAALGLAATRVPSATVARKKRKRTPKVNAFGCLDIGKTCRGNSGACCSGICEGKKPKNGKRDKSSCVAHSVSSCLASDDVCEGMGSLCGGGGGCYRTTGQASFCGVGGGPCTPCARDTDCEALLGPGAACIICASCPGDLDTACAMASV